jgi:colanic acid biosynthesis glycosyl transferase WcaI
VWTSRFGRVSLAGRALDYLTFYTSAAWRLMVCLRRGDVVVAKTDPPLISVVVAVCARLKGAVLVNWLQDVFPEVARSLGLRIAGGCFGAVLLALRNWSLRSARFNVVLGDRMAALLSDQLASVARVRVIHNWSDGLAIYPVAPADNALRAQWGLSDRFVVAYSGNMGRAHEFDTIVGAARKLQHDPRIVFLFIGDGYGKPALEQAVKGLPNVQFRPYQPRHMLGQSLTAPDVHLISLRPELEGLIVPSKLYGVMAAGRAVLFIGAQDGEVSRLLQVHDCGYAVRLDDVDTLTERIASMAIAPEMTQRMGCNARAVFVRCFDQSVALRAWQDLLAEAS